MSGGFLMIECSYCKKDMGKKPCCEEVSGRTTHSICRPCYVEQLTKAGIKVTEEELKDEC